MIWTDVYGGPSLFSHSFIHSARTTGLQFAAFAARSSVMVDVDQFLMRERREMGEKVVPVSVASPCVPKARSEQAQCSFCTLKRFLTARAYP
jgi:hypothetical protein